MSLSRLLETAQRVSALGAGARLADDDLVAAVRAVGDLRRLVDALGVEYAGELERRCEPGGSESPDRRRGHVGAASLISAEAGVDRAEAWAWCGVGAATAERVALSGEPLPPARPVLAAALEDGSISVGAADRIRRTLDDVAALASPEQLETFERTLVEVAPHISSRELRGVCRRVADLVDPDGAEPREDDLRRRSTVSIHQQDDGLTRIVAKLHPEAAAHVIAALDARTAPRRQPTFSAVGDRIDGSETDVERRPLASRRVDALVAIARESLVHDAGQVAGAPVTVMVTVGLEQLVSGLGTARLSGVDEPISAATARRMASDAAIIPVVLGSASETLDQGVASRLATTGQRRALDRRDQGCIWGRCDAPPGWCEVAHIRPWAEGGPTDLDNLVLLCPFHHRLFDAEGWDLRWEGGTPWLIPPAHLDAHRTPRRAGPLPLSA